MCVSIFCRSIVWNIFPSKKIWAKYDRKCIFVFMYSTLYSWMIIMKVEFCGQFLKKFSNIKVHENLSSGRWVFPCGKMDGRMDRHDEANSCFFAILWRHLKRMGIYFSVQGLMLL
jgi:hypothetical protein